MLVKLPRSLDIHGLRKRPKPWLGRAVASIISESILKFWELWRGPETLCRASSTSHCCRRRGKHATRLNYIVTSTRSCDRQNHSCLAEVLAAHIAFTRLAFQTEVLGLTWCPGSIFSASKIRDALHSLDALEIVASECQGGATILQQAERENIQRKHKNPPLVHLVPPVLPDHLRGDDDGPIRSDEEKEAKRMRSASTTPRSVRGTDPDDYDRVVGVSSVGPQETIRFGEGNATDIDDN